MCPFHDDSSHFFRIYQNKEVVRCYHGYCSYAPLSDIVKHQNQCTIPSSSRICIQILFTYPALPKPLSRPLFPFCLSTNMFSLAFQNLEKNKIFLELLRGKGKYCSHRNIYYDFCIVGQERVDTRAAHDALLFVT